MRLDLPDDLPTGAPKRRARLFLQGICDHALAAHLLPDSPRPPVKKTARVFGCVIHDTNSGNLGC